MECSAFIDDMLNGGSNGQTQGADAAARRRRRRRGRRRLAEPQAADAIFDGENSLLRRERVSRSETQSDR